MNLTEEQYELAERYLTGQLSGKELSDFKRMLEENPALKVETEKIRKVNELLFMEGLKKELPAIQKAQEQYFFHQQLKQYGKWMGGFLVLVTAIAVVWTLNGEEEKINSKTAAENVVIDPGQNTVDVSIEPGKKKNVQPIPSISSPIEKIIEPLPKKSEQENRDPDIQKKNSPVAATTQDTVKNEKKIGPLKEDPCKELITASFETLPSCENKSEGSIRLKSVSGGSKPYWLSLDNGNYRETTVFQLLTEGDYQVTIKDSRGCVSKPYLLKVPSRSCLEASRDYVFSYQNTQEFIFPDMNENDFSFQVYNSAGGLEYSVTVLNGMPDSWNGYSTSGQRLSVGSYSFRFMADGKILRQGTITIVD